MYETDLHIIEHTECGKIYLTQPFAYCSYFQVNFASLHTLPHNTLGNHVIMTLVALSMLKQYEMSEAGLGSCSVVFIPSLIKILIKICLCEGQRNRRNYSIRLSFAYSKGKKLQQNAI